MKAEPVELLRKYLLSHFLVCSREIWLHTFDHVLLSAGHSLDILVNENRIRRNEGMLTSSAYIAQRFWPIWTWAPFFGFLRRAASVANARIGLLDML